MPRQSTQLAKTLTVGEAISLAISIVIGSGLLTLPGVAYQRSGNTAFYAWLLDALLVIPLLVIFADMGSKYPGAGGIAGVVQAAFSRPAGAATELLVMGTLGLGLPTVALAGGYYFTLLIHGNTLSTILASFTIILLAGLVNCLGITVSGRIQQLLTFFLVATLTVVTVVTLMFGHHHTQPPLANVQTWYTAIPSLGMIFFAYTGWEMLSFTSEEYRNPKRDFPLAVVISFLIVVFLYLGIAFAIQQTLLPTDARLATVPIAVMLPDMIGGIGVTLIAALGVIIVVANLIGAIWAASRLVYSSAREGLLPQWLSYVEPRFRTPRFSILTVCTAFLVIEALHFLGVLPLSLLFQLAGQNFFILYGLSVIAYIKLARSAFTRGFGTATLLIVLVTMSTFGWTLLYPLLLMASGWSIVKIRGRKLAAKSSSGEEFTTSKR